MRYTNLLKKAGYVTLAISLAIFILGLYFFLCGPEEEVISLSSTRDVKITLTHKGNWTTFLHPFEGGMVLIEYHIYNLSEFLLGRTIDIRLETENKSRVNLYIMNSTQLKHWRNSSIAGGIISKEGVNDVQLMFSPEDIWRTYYLVLVNPKNTDVNAHIKLTQKFFAKVLNYKHAFKWFNIALLAIILSSMLAIPLKLTIDDLILRTIHKLTPTRYSGYAPTRVPPIYQIALVVCVFMVCLYAFLSDFLLFTRSSLSPFGVSMWRDCFYRFGITAVVCGICLLITFSLASIIWHSLIVPLDYKYYPDLNMYIKVRKINADILISLVKTPRSLIIIALCMLLPLFLPAHEKDVATYVCLSFPFICMYLGYIFSLAYFKTRRKIVTRTEIDFKYIKASLSTGILISATFIIMWRACLPFLSLILQYILDRNILISRCQDHAFASKHVLSLLNDFTSLVALIVPLALSLVRYSFIFFSSLYLHQKEEFIGIPLPANALAECMLELTFFFLVFGLNLWLQFLISPPDLHKIPWILVASFAAASFREYLEAIRSA